MSVELADDVRNVLIAMADKAGGVLEPEKVVAAAKSPRSPLHAAFEWDDRQAAHLQRLDTARQLIRSIRIEVTYHGTLWSVPAYIKQPDKSGVYSSITVLRTDEDAAREAIVGAFRRAEQALTYARSVAIALRLTGEVDGVLKRLARAIARAERDGQTTPGVGRA
jgi:hypothetical protein